jgi:hypothetical protein
VDDTVKPLPAILTTVSGELIETELGLMLLSVTGGYVVIFRVIEFEVPPPGAGVNTVICAVPTAAILLAGI